MAIKSGDTLYAYIYLDPNNPPQEVMLQWNDGDWNQRAYWGQNLINWGTNGTTSRRYMGRLPAGGGWVRLEVPAAHVGLAGKTVNGLAFTLYGGRAWWDRAGVRRAVHEVTKYYEFNGQRIARRQDGVLTYLHTDHLGSTLLATNSSGTMVGEHRYRAYGSSRGGDELATDHRFTGQKLDGTGLYYYNARYYDPEIGAFISPDTLVPDPTNLLDYNRYSYVRGNPLKYTDPTGHCPKPPEEYANAICIAGFIPTKESQGFPGGWIIYQADDRNFSSDSTGQSSRFYLWVDADSGEFIGDPKENVHSTVQLFPEQEWLGGGVHEPRDSHNNFTIKQFEDGTIYVTYSVVCAGPGCLVAPGPEGELYFQPNHSGTYDVAASVERFPNLEGYHWKKGELQGDSLFQVQNFSQQELSNDLVLFETGMKMFDWQGRDTLLLQNENE